MNTIIIDADGPLLDGKEKHCACYRQLAGQLGFQPLDDDVYWNMKLEQTPLLGILRASQADALLTAFQELWLRNIETLPFLALDRLQPSAPAKLKDWSASGWRLVLASLRQDSDKLLEQLNAFNISKYFQALCVVGPTQGAAGKTEAVLKQFPDIRPQGSLWIGDTEIDIEAARRIGCPVWALTCGLRSQEFLERLNPDFIGSEIGEIDPRKVWKTN